MSEGRHVSCRTFRILMSTWFEILFINLFFVSFFIGKIESSTEIDTMRRDALSAFLCVLNHFKRSYLPCQNWTMQNQLFCAKQHPSLRFRKTNPISCQNDQNNIRYGAIYYHHKVRSQTLTKTWPTRLRNAHVYTYTSSNERWVVDLVLSTSVFALFMWIFMWPHTFRPMVLA